jgi:predicted ATP-binding protein involved in virulence
MIDIKEVHEKCLDFLLEKYPDLTFQLRSKTGGRLLNRYWFHGNDQYLTISFWTGWDFNNNTPNIYLNITNEGVSTLILTDIEGGEKAKFFKKIAQGLKVKQLNGKKNERFVWIREYKEKDYLLALESFIQTDRLLIDSFIDIANIGIQAVDKTEFERNLTNIQELRENKISSNLENKISDIDTPLSIKRLEIENIGHFEKLDIDLSKPVICFIGENGSGKSTILKLIVLGLTNINNEDEDSLIKSTNPKLQNLIRIEKIEQDKSVYASSGLIRLHYAIGDKKYKNRINFNGKVEKRLDSNTNRIFDYSSDHSFDKVQTWMLSAFDPAELYSKREKMKPVMTKIFEVIGHIIGSEMTLISSKEGEIFVITEDSPNGIPLRLLSQGYANVIGWVGYFMKRLAEMPPENADFTQTPAICLIDELDTYLHPKWQATILDVLAQTFSKTQFIVTTHSPYIVTHLENVKGSVQVYHISKTEATPIQTSGRDISATSLEFFGVQRRPMFYQRLIDDVFADFDRYENDVYNGSIEQLKGKIEQLEKLLGKTDPDVETAKSLFETLEIIES